MPKALRIPVAVIAAAASFVALPARAASATVEVHDNFFTPDTLEIQSGDSVSWNVKDGGHTVRSDDEVDGLPLFEFPSGNETLRAGDSYTHSFVTPGVYGYRCEVHPGSMTGVIYVDVEPLPPAVRTVPSTDFPTIAAAVADAPPGTTIEISPGAYPEEVIVDQADITLRGTGMSPSEVVLDGGGRLGVGIAAFREGIRVENITVRGYLSRGLFFRDADRFRVHLVHAIGNGEHGIRAMRSRGGGITHAIASGSSTAGFSITECDACGALIEQVTAEKNGVGILVQNAGHVLVLDSSASHNNIGVVFETALPGSTDATRTQAPARGATIRGNSLISNVSGISIRGGRLVDISQNDISGGEVGVTIRGAPVASTSVIVSENTVTRYAGAGLMWDLLGADICFSSNTDPARGSAGAVTHPPYLELLFAC